MNKHLGKDMPFWVPAQAIERAIHAAWRNKDSWHALSTYRARSNMRSTIRGLVVALRIVREATKPTPTREQTNMNDSKVDMAVNVSAVGTDDPVITLMTTRMARLRVGTEVEPTVSELRMELRMTVDQASDLIRMLEEGVRRAKLLQSACQDPTPAKVTT